MAFTDGQLFPQPIYRDLTLEVNGTPNGNQNILNLKPGTNIAITDDGVGDVTITSTAPVITLQTNGVANTSQSKLNLVAGSNVTLSSDSTGDVTISAVLATHSESLTDGAGNFIFDVGDIITCVGVPN